MPKNVHDKSDETTIRFKISREDKERLTQKVQWGDITHIYSALTKQLIALLEDYDPDVVKAGIISENVSLTDLLEYQKKEK